MASPVNNAPPVGSDSGALTPPDFSDLQGDIGGIESSYDPQIAQETQQAESMEARAVNAQEETSALEEREAGEMTAEEQEIDQWVNSTPTRQASYATSMHAAPMLALLTALGGRMTRLNGMQMLAATNGIVQGLNEASEQKYQAAMDQWKQSFEAMRIHQQDLMEKHRLMLTAYQGRADAYQKAAEAARRMTGDLLTEEQKKISEKTDLFKAQQAAWAKLQNVNLARERLQIQEQRVIAQTSHWKKLEQASAKNPQLATAIKAEQFKFNTKEEQIRDNLKRIGQISSSLQLTEEQKAEQSKPFEDENDELRMEQEQILSSLDAIAATPIQNPYSTTPTGSAPGAGGPPMATPTRPNGAPAAQPRTPAPAVDAPPGVPPTNAKGWRLNHDKNDLWFYLSPDGKQWEIVKAAPTQPQSVH